MTDVAEPISTDSPAPAAGASVNNVPPKSSSSLAILVALLALALSALALAQPYVPWLKRLMPAAEVVPSVPAVDYSADINALRDQLRDVTARPVPTAAAPDIAPALDPVVARLDALDQRLTAVDAAAAEQRQKAIVDAVRPAALSLIRVENRLLRGEPFVTELALLKQQTVGILTAEQDRDLTAAMAGVETTRDLMIRLRSEERAARRAERLAAANNPLDRVWAELQSLVLIKNTTAPNVPDDRFDGFIAAVRQGDMATTAAAWQALSDKAKQVLYPIYGEVERRQRAEAALHALALVVLVPPATSTAAH